MRCSQCKYNDGVVYTSNPIKHRCTITGKYYEYGEECDLDLSVLKSEKPVMLPMNGFDADVASHLCCPNCKNPIVSQFVRDYKPKYCSECGQKLDWSEVK